RKVAFGASKDAILAFIGATVLAFLGKPEVHQPHDVIPYAIAYGCIMVADDLISIPVMARATRTSLGEIFRTNLDIRLLFSLIRFAISIATLYVVQWEPQLLLGIAPIALSLHLT